MRGKSLYQVDYITQCKTENWKRMFRVKWVGYPSSQNTWEPEEHLCPTLVQNYFEQEKNKQNKKIFKKPKQNVSKQSSKLSFIIKDIVLPQSKQDEVEFTVQRGTRKETFSREYLYNKHPQKLAAFYLSVYKKTNNL